MVDFPPRREIGSVVDVVDVDDDDDDDDHGHSHDDAQEEEEEEGEEKEEKMTSDEYLLAQRGNAFQESLYTHTHTHARAWLHTHTLTHLHTDTLTHLVRSIRFIRKHFWRQLRSHERSRFSSLFPR